MSLVGIDKDYVECCRGYLKSWIETYHAEKYQISEEVLDEIILTGGEGLRVLQTTFLKVLDCAKEEGVETIDMLFVEHVLKSI